MLLPIHIAAGGIAILLGAVTLSVRKGGLTHRRVGLLFVVAMVAMAGTGAVLAAWKGERLNMAMGVLTVYLVTTALLTLRPRSRWTDGGALLVALAVGTYEVALGFEIRSTPTGIVDGLPATPAFVFGGIALLAAAGDARVLARGIEGTRRLARHLWRMCFGLFIATASFFSIEARVARVLPDPFTSAPLRTLPIVLVLGSMLYWLWRVRRRRPPVVIRRERAARGSTAAARPVEVLQETR